MIMTALLFILICALTYAGLSLAAYFTRTKANAAALGFLTGILDAMLMLFVMGLP